MGMKRIYANPAQIEAIQTELSTAGLPPLPQMEIDGMSRIRAMQHIASLQRKRRNRAIDGLPPAA